LSHSLVSEQSFCCFRIFLLQSTTQVFSKILTQRNGPVLK
jgi:hypothetical protein